MVLYEESSKSNHSRRQPVTSIIEWGQFFAQYIAILAHAKLERATDLVGYKHLILEAHLEYYGDRWLVYNCQITATHPSTPWAWRDGDLWNMMFRSSHCRPYCLHCFGSTHALEPCCGASDTTPKGRPPFASSSAYRGETYTDYQILLLEKDLLWQLTQCSLQDLRDPKYIGNI